MLSGLFSRLNCWQDPRLDEGDLTAVVGQGNVANELDIRTDEPQVPPCVHGYHYDRRSATSHRIQEITPEEEAAARAKHEIKDQGPPVETEDPEEQIYGEIRDSEGMNLHCDHNPRKSILPKAAGEDSTNEPSPLSLLELLVSVPLREIASNLDRESLRHLHMTSSTMNRRLRELDLAPPPHPVQMIVISFVEHERMTSPLTKIAPDVPTCVIKAECDGKRIEWYLHSNFVIIRKSGWTFLKREMTIEEIFCKITGRIQKDDYVEDQYDKNFELFRYQNKGVSERRIEFLANGDESSYDTGVEIVFRQQIQY